MIKIHQVNAQHNDRVDPFSGGKKREQFSLLDTHVLAASYLLFTRWYMIGIEFGPYILSPSSDASKPQGFGDRLKARVLPFCGVIAPLVFIFMTILGGAMRPGYSHIADTVSELMSPGSPNRLLLSTIFTIYALLIILFGGGMLQFVRRSSRSVRLGATAAMLYIAGGVINVTIATIFPQDPWGTTFTFPGMMHLILSGVIGLLQMSSMALFGIWLRRTGFSHGLGVYSLFTASAVLLMVAIFLGIAGTPLMGLAERSLIVVGLTWTFVTALWMISRTSSAKGI
jgi:hypothetical protein